ncbi:MAG: hypothetical protein IGS03_00935 [Candidatus Sericytochromatia bacterium]|nr:hypothetical protein [Candidatus Sericytochromatia bacterium]
MADTPQVSTLSWKPNWEIASVDINQSGDFFFSPRSDYKSELRWDALIRINRKGQQTQIRTGPEVRKPESYITTFGYPSHTPAPIGDPGYVAVFGSRIWVSDYQSNRQLRVLDTAGLWVHEEVWLEGKYPEKTFWAGNAILTGPDGKLFGMGVNCDIFHIQTSKQIKKVFASPPIEQSHVHACPIMPPLTVDANGYFYSIPSYSRPKSIPAEDWPPMSNTPPDRDAHDEWISSRHEVYRIHSNNYERWAGMAEAGFKDGFREQARFNHAEFLTAARDGTLYVSDTGNHAIRQVSPTGEVTTLAGDGTAGSEDDKATQARFDTPRQILLGPCHRLYVFDNNGVREIALPPGPSSERWGPPVNPSPEQTS